MPKERYNISVNDLFLDTDNPRISSQQDENSCIETILNMNEGHILNLAEDIAKNGLRVENIIVSEQGGGSTGNKWIVRDGNRRITAIKLLSDPSKAPNKRLQDKFYKIKKQYNNFPTSVECTEYTDERELLDVLFSRHGGANNGVGQIEWGAMAKAKYSEKIQENNPNIKVLNFLRWAKEYGNIESDDNFAITTLLRIMSQENLGRIGFDLKGDDIILVGNADIAFEIVNRIISDIKSEIATSRTLNTVKHQKDYIDELCNQYGENSAPAALQTGGQAIQGNKAQQSQVGQSKVVNKNSVTRSVPKNPKDRPRLFHKGKISFAVPADQKKAQAILAEIKSLRTDKNPIAVAMLLRSFIELSTEYYITNNKISNGNTIAEKIKECAKHMKSVNKIDKKQEIVIDKIMSNPRDVLNISTLHSFVHADYSFPDHRTINTYWDGIEFYVKACWT
ncbi:MAG: ParB/Srx family N-terminal domain-containing protein [Deltaproteobacteria bacterium]|nr:ParB/Srx family N-terminal domain-containing protein [Deltaproteobacteria bacterium]